MPCSRENVGAILPARALECTEEFGQGKASRGQGHLCQWPCGNSFQKGCSGVQPPTLGQGSGVQCAGRRISCKSCKKNHVDNLSPGLQMLPNTESLMTASEHAYPASTKALEKRLKKGLQTFLSLYIYSAFSQGKKEHTFSTSWSTLLILVKERDPDRATKMYKYYPRFRDMNADILVWAP